MKNMNQQIKDSIQDACSATPDMDRARRNLERVLSSMDDPNALVPHMREAALLLSCSQFLSNHSARRPADLFWALSEMNRPVTRERVLADAAGLLEVPDATAYDSLRLFKKRWLMAVTLRDLTGLPCPTCGGTHAAVSLANGRLAEAFAASPLVAGGAILFALWLFAGVATTVVPAWRRSLELSPGEKRTARVLAVLIGVCGWIWVIRQSII